MASCSEIRGFCWRTKTCSRGQPWGLTASGFLSNGDFFGLCNSFSTGITFLERNPVKTLPVLYQVAMRMDLSSHYRRCLMWKPWVGFVNGFAFRGESHHCAQILTHVIFNSRHEDYIVAVGCTTWVHRGGHRRDETTSRTPQTFPIQCQFVLQG